MSRNEDQTRRELIDPRLRDRGWTEDLSAANAPLIDSRHGSLDADA